MLDPPDDREAADVLPKVRQWNSAPLPVDSVSGCLLPGPNYPLSFPWTPGTSPIEIQLAASWLEAPLARGIGFVLVDLVGVHAIAERLSWGYGNTLIGEVGRRLQQWAEDAPTFRTGADAFLVTLRELGYEAAEACVEEIRYLVSAPVPYPALSTSIGLAATVGVAISEGGEEPAELFQRAIEAASHAQQRGATHFLEARR